LRKDHQRGLRRPRPCGTLLIMCNTARLRVVACTLALVQWSCGGDARENATSSEPEPPRTLTQPGTWQQLPAPPLSGRVSALVAAVGDAIVVAGGWSWLCPPGADCVAPSTPPYIDGAAYDVSLGQWRAIADAPRGIHATVNAVVGADVYALSQCSPGPTCPAGGALLRYRSDADEWDVLPGLDQAETSNYRLVAVADGVVAYSQSDEDGVKPDYRFLAGEGRWVTLPADPLPPAYDRALVEYDGRLLLFGTALTDGETNTKLTAGYDPASEAWQTLADSGTLGFQVWRAGSLFYLNPHFRNAGGGIYDAVANAWRPLPEPPYHDLVGVIGDSEASYADGYASGWLLDARSGGWLEIEPRPADSDIYDVVTAVAPAQRLVVFGGQRWLNGEGQLLNETWLWRPPVVAGLDR
jgi:hypothetical protein